MLNRCAYYALILLTLPITAMAIEHTEKNALDPKATEIMSTTSTFLNRFTDFVIEGEGYLEQIFPNGQKLQFSNKATVYTRRPDRMRVNLQGDYIDQEYYYDGKSITLLGKQVNYFATISNVPETLTEAFDYAADYFGLNVPFTSFFAKDLNKVMTEKANSSRYLGLSSVRGIESHHLSFRQDDVDWQLWIENGEQPFPRKLVITEKLVIGAPQFTIEFVKWDVSTKLKDDIFVFEPPKEAEKIEFIQPTKIKVTD